MRSLNLRLWIIAAGAAGTSAFAQPPAARRIASVGSALTETLYALGAQADLVGRLRPRPAER